MLAAMSAFDASTSSVQSSSATNLTQEESDKSDTIAAKLREKSVTVQRPRDALFVAIHALLLEAGTEGFFDQRAVRISNSDGNELLLCTGYKLSVAAGSDFALPENWDANNANGLFNTAYVHPNDDSINFSLQVRWL